MTSREHVATLLKHEIEFDAIFPRRLRSFMSSITGFNVITFDEMISPSTHESTYDAIRRLYGDRAVDVIQSILSTTDK